MSDRYDIFFSYAHVNGAAAQALVGALRAAGLTVWFDDTEIPDFASISRSIEVGLARSKAVVAYYSSIYPLRRACQWELTAAFLTAQRAGHPGQRVLVVNPERDAMHIQPIELRDGKYLSAPGAGDAEGTRRLVAALGDAVSAISGQFADIHPLRTPRWFGMRGVGSTRFVGRLGELWQLHSNLHATDFSLIAGIAASSSSLTQIAGLGGMGKSLLAEEYGLRFGSAFPGGIYWLQAQVKVEDGATVSPERIEAERERQFREVAASIGIPIDNRPLAEIEGAIARALEHATEASLWIVDDIPSGLDGQLIRRWFAPSPIAKTVFTTRTREYAGLSSVLNLDVLGADDGLELLTARRRPEGPEEEEAARGIVEDLGRHALALDVTGARLAAARGLQSFAEFRTELASPDSDALDLAAEFAGALPNGHEAGIASTLLHSIRQLQDPALDFLRLASVVAATPIPAKVVAAVFREVDGLGAGAAMQRAVRALADADGRGLATVPEARDDLRTVHPLVVRTVRFYDLRTDRVHNLRAAAVSACTAILAEMKRDPHATAIAAYVPHARALAIDGTGLPEAHLLGAVARYDFAHGAYRSAELLYSREVELLRALLSADHVATLDASLGLAYMLIQEAKFARARQILEETVEALRRTLGPDHTETLVAMSSLSDALTGQGDYPAARALQQQVVDTYRRTIETANASPIESTRASASAIIPYALSAMSRFGSILSKQGDYAAARLVQEQLVEWQRRISGPDDEGSLSFGEQLAITLHAQGEVAKAVALEEEMLERTRRVLEPHHPVTLHRAGILGAMLSDRGDYARAQLLQEEVISGLTETLGPDHPRTVAAQASLAMILKARGDLGAARTLMERALAVDRRVSGPEHPATLRDASNLASLLHAQGDHPAARALQEDTLAIARRGLGPLHPTALTCAHNLATMLAAGGEWDAARQVQLEVLDGRRRTLGPEHPDTMSAQSNVAMICYEQGDLAQARTMLQAALEATRRVMGQTHPLTSRMALNLLLVLHKLGDVDAEQHLLAADLAWLLTCDPTSLGAEQREALETVRELTKRWDEEKPG